jgi:RHS repeat-associated protein
MIRTNIFLYRGAAVLSALALFNISVPLGAVYTFGAPLKADLEARAKVSEQKRRDLSKRRAKSASRVLTIEEMERLQGRAGENPYFAGQNKWDVVYKGVNIMTGNFSTSATDLSFEGGYGVPVNVTRSYSANNADDGPLGKGWTLSVDVRSTAGGLLKSGGAPIRSVPVNFKERHSAQLDDANAVSGAGTLAQPPEAVVATDASGHEETIQKDADGILSTPPWDKNTIETEYETTVVGAAVYQLMTKNVVRTPEGAQYVYTKRGVYNNGGSRPWNQPTATPEPTNVLKIDSVTDRHGNQTTYTYSGVRATFQKINGEVQEDKLTQIAMPNGHTIDFVWTGNRITKAFDNGTTSREVLYAYGERSNTAGLLTTVTSPGGKATRYDYGTAVLPNYPVPVSGPAATGLLVSITDPRGLATGIAYAMADTPVDLYGGQQRRVYAYKISAPNGMRTFFGRYPIGYGPNDPFTSSPGSIWYMDRLPDNTIVNQSIFTVNFDQAAKTFGVSSLAGPTTIAQLTNRIYDARTQDLLIEESTTRPNHYQGIYSARGLSYPSFGSQKVRSDKTYNFMGNPLSQTTTETSYDANGVVQSNVARTTDYAYWGKDRYYQQMAVRDQSGRYSFTDYFTDAAATGKKGQTYRVYGAKFTQFAEDTSISVPAGTASSKTWRYRLRPTNSATHMAEFAYDAKGRPVDGWKLQKTTTTPWTYVQTRTLYGSDQAPSWGAPSAVTEAYGTTVARTTSTLSYDSAGRANLVQDAKGQKFQTVYDGDGQVQSVYRTDVNPSQAVVTYQYGTTDGTLTNGMVTGVTDGLSGVSQSFTYQISGGGKGQVSQVSETRGGTLDNTVTYSYTTEGDRATATHTTPNGTTAWAYRDYVQVGAALSPRRLFQTMVRLDPTTMAPTAEEFHYAYDTSGRLLEATFAQTPDPSYTPAAGTSYYTSAKPAVKRARAHYEYDPAGRVTLLAHWWDTLSNGAYSSEAVLANACDYETTGLNRGLKTASRTYVKDAANPALFALEKSQGYMYEAERDFLTTAKYYDNPGSGTPTVTNTWNYDAAGNRQTSCDYDLLNRQLLCSNFQYVSDVLGNRTQRTSLSTAAVNDYTWDVQNRMTSHSFTPSGGSTATYSYAYRADGMRVSKSRSSTNYGKYRYDGQMQMEDETVLNGATTLTRFGLGARGVDYAHRVKAGSPDKISFPLYDAHGNGVGTLTRDAATGGYLVGDRRDYNAWGGVRSGATSSDPKGRYVASLGHVQDDESNLVYMRARYYDAAQGRFISEDPAMDGGNWFVYCGNDPTNRIDQSGNTDELNTIFAQITGVLLALQNYQNSFDSVAAKREFLNMIKNQLLQFSSRAGTIAADAYADAAELAREAANTPTNEKGAEMKIRRMQAKQQLGLKGKAAAAVADLGIQAVEALLAGLI